MSVQRGGRSQPGKAQPPSRRRMAVRVAPVNGRRVRPTSMGTLGAVEDGGQDGGVAGDAAGRLRG